MHRSPPSQHPTPPHPSSPSSQHFSQALFSPAGGFRVVQFQRNNGYYLLKNTSRATLFWPLSAQPASCFALRYLTAPGFSSQKFCCLFSGYFHLPAPTLLQCFEVPSLEATGSDRLRFKWWKGRAGGIDPPLLGLSASLWGRKREGGMPGLAGGKMTQPLSHPIPTMPHPNPGIQGNEGY